MSSAIFNAGTVKILKDVLKFKSGNQITYNGSVDPTVTATAGLKGDLYIQQSTGNLFKKLTSGTNTNWAIVPDTAYIAALVANYIPLTQKGAANGVAPLDGSSKIPAAYIPGGYLQYKGMWNASTNTPTLADGTGSAGTFYEINVAGTQNLGSGSQTFKVGDWVVHDGTRWDISTNSNEVVSVNGLTGAVTLTTTNIAEGLNLYFTSGRFDTNFAGKSTTNLVEGTNLYYTAARFNTAFAGKTTSDLTEGGNLYYTNARFNTQLATKSTTDIAEGTNLYYTNARFDTRLATKSTTNLVEGTNLYYTTARAQTDALTVAANKTLSNLTNPTSVNQDLLPAVDSTQQLGNTSKAWGALFTGSLFANGTMNITARLNAAMNFVAAQFRFSGTASTPGQLVINDVGDINNVTLTVPNVLGANAAYQLPVLPVSSGYLLSSTTGGVMSWTAPVALSNINVDTFAGTGAQTVFTLTAAPGSINNTQVFVDGVAQPKSTYSLSTTILTFSEAPPNSSVIEVNYGKALSVGTPSDGTVTKAKLAALGEQLTPSCGVFTTTSQSVVDVTNLSATFTTSGRMVAISLTGDGSGNSGGFQLTHSTATNRDVSAAIYLYNVTGSAFLDQQTIGFSHNGSLVNNTNTFYVPASSYQFFYKPAAGTYTVKIQVQVTGPVGSTLNLRYAKLLAREL